MGSVIGGVLLNWLAQGLALSSERVGFVVLVFVALIGILLWHASKETPLKQEAALKEEAPNIENSGTDHRSFLSWIREQTFFSKSISPEHRQKIRERMGVFIITAITVLIAWGPIIYIIYSDVQAIDKQFARYEEKECSYVAPVCNYVDWDNLLEKERQYELWLAELNRKLEEEHQAALAQTKKEIYEKKRQEDARKWEEMKRWSKNDN